MRRKDKRLLNLVAAVVMLLAVLVVAGFTVLAHGAPLRFHLVPLAGLGRCRRTCCARRRVVRPFRRVVVLACLKEGGHGLVGLGGDGAVLLDGGGVLRLEVSFESLARFADGLHVFLKRFFIQCVGGVDGGEGNRGQSEGQEKFCVHGGPLCKEAPRHWPARNEAWRWPGRGASIPHSHAPVLHTL